MKGSHPGYERDEILNTYLLFHYGSNQDQLPFSFGPQNSLHFPVRCVTECVDLKALPANAAAIDLGCAVGRSSFELARHCKRVLGIDSSHLFIETAKQLQTKGEVEYRVMEEGMQSSIRKAARPQNVDAAAIEFRCCDVLEILEETAQYDLVLAANLICRLPDPETFIRGLPKLLKSNGQLIIISPYSWLEEFTSHSNWLNKKQNSLEAIKELFGTNMQLIRTLDMPFLIREHFRKYEWCVSQASIWRSLKDA
jgi:putative 4-mercaptohistidine N1-methyltranferase